VSALPHEMPDWLEAATRDVLDSAISAEFASDSPQGRRMIADAILRFRDAVEANGGDDRHFLGLVMGLGVVTRECAPPGAFGDGDGPTIAVIEDRITGEIVDDPDAEVEDAQGAAALAAMRIVAAMVDGNTDLAYDVFTAVGHNDDDSGALMLLLLAEYAGAMAVAKLHREGQLSPEALEILAAREAARDAAAPPPPAEPQPRTGPDGLRYVPLPKDERDTGPDAIARAAPHGNAQYAMTTYLPGQREQMAAFVHRQIEDARQAGQLCGVHHVEDIEPWQVPHTARAQMNRHLRRVKRQTGREPQLLRAWQHTGPCPEGEVRP
jgi:hypothetical protein